MIKTRRLKIGRKGRGKSRTKSANTFKLVLVWYRMIFRILPGICVVHTLAAHVLPGLLLLKKFKREKNRREKEKFVRISLILK